jgi:phosphoribosylformylglycinamidine synthase
MVRAVGEELCPKLGIAIPVGKDSLSMRHELARGRCHQECGRAGIAHHLGFAPVKDVRRTLVPVLRPG